MIKRILLIILLLLSTQCFASDYSRTKNFNNGATSNGDDVEFEFDAAATSSATKADKAGYTATGTTTYSAVATDITTAANEDLTLAPNGTGNIIATTDELQFNDGAATISTTSNADLTVTPNGTGAVVISKPELTGYYRKNLLINGCFRLNQRGTTYTSATTPANSDDTYLLDRWILLSNGNDIVDVSQEASVVPTGAFNSIKLDVETANTKFGILQVIEARNCKNIIGGTASLTFKARITGTTINAIRAAVISWDGAADTVTSDVVNVWGGAGTNPTMVANWTLENTPAALTAPTTSFQTYTIENISIDTASTTNVAVFIWTDDVTMDVGDFLYITDVQLESGANATSFEQIPIQDTIELCQRYYEKSYVLTTAPATVTNEGRYNQSGSVDADGNLFFNVNFSTRKRILPTMTAYRHDNGATGAWFFSDNGAAWGASAVTWQDGYELNANIFIGGQTSGQVGSVYGQWTADAEL